MVAVPMLAVEWPVAGNGSKQERVGHTRPEDFKTILKSFKIDLKCWAARAGHGLLYATSRFEKDFKYCNKPSGLWPPTNPQVQGLVSIKGWDVYSFT
jgi:hypothetical protein